MDALWYGEVVFSVDGQSDYNYAYSMDPFEPDPREIPYPDGAVVISTKVHPLHLPGGD